MDSVACRLRGLVALAPVLALSAACEEDPPPPHQGAYNVQLTDTGIDCPINSHKEALGNVGPTGKPELIADGTNNASVECTVEKSGGGFNVSANLDAAATVIVEVSGLSEAATVDAPVQGQVTFASSITQKPYSSNAMSLCNFWIAKDQGQYVKNGEAWFTFSCPGVFAQTDQCEISDSYVALKNCTGLVPKEEE